MSVTTSLWY